MQLHHAARNAALQSAERAGFGRVNILPQDPIHLSTIEQLAREHYNEGARGDRADSFHRADLREALHREPTPLEVDCYVRALWQEDRKAVGA